MLEQFSTNLTKLVDELNKTKQNKSFNIIIKYNAWFNIISVLFIMYID